MTRRPPRDHRLIASWHLDRPVWHLSHIEAMQPVSAHGRASASAQGARFS